MATMCRAGYGLAGPGLVLIERLHEIGASVLHEGGGVPAHLRGHEVERAELVVVAPATPVRVLRAPARVLLGGRWRALLDPHAETLTLRLRSPLVAPVIGVRSLLRRGDDRPVPRLPRAARRVPGRGRCPSTTPSRSRASTTCGRCSPTATASRSSRARCSIAQALLRHHDGPPPDRGADDPCRRSPCSTRPRTPRCARRCSGRSDRARSLRSSHPCASSRGRGSRRSPTATRSTCVTTTRRRSPRRSRRCSWAFPSRTRSCWSAGSTRSSNATPTCPGSVPRARRRTRSSTPTSWSWSPSGGRRAVTGRPTSSTTSAPTPAPTDRSTTTRSRRSWRRSSSVAPRPCPRPWPVAATSSGARPTSAPRLVADLSAVPNAFEEMLRHQLPLQFVGRTVTVDTEVAGVADAARASASSSS